MRETKNRVYGHETANVRFAVFLKQQQQHFIKTDSYKLVILYLPTLTHYA